MNGSQKESRSKLISSRTAETQLHVLSCAVFSVGTFLRFFLRSLLSILFEIRNFRFFWRKMVTKASYV